MMKKVCTLVKCTFNPPLLPVNFAHSPANYSTLHIPLQVTNVHRVVQFRQKPWMKEYIDYNTRLRAQATSEFEKEFYKLMNNS